MRRESARVVSGDGTPIAWHTYSLSSDSSALREMPSVVLTNGLGSTPRFWTRLIEGLAPTRRVVHWDYRGHGESGLSRSHDYTIATQAEDLARVTLAVRAAGSSASPPVHIAFSMGVTVLLELYRRRPELVRAMVLVAGGADHPYAASRAFRIPGVRTLVRGGLRAAAPVVPRLAPLVRALSKSKAIYPTGRALGALAPEASRDDIEHFFRTVGHMDLGAYWGTLRGLLASHASDVLPTVRVPVLIVAPAWDVMAPACDLEQLRATIPRAEWLKIPHTGHAVLLEAGDQVAAGVNAFLGRLLEE